MNRREFLQVLGLAAGASVLPVTMTAASTNAPVLVNSHPAIDVAIAPITDSDRVGVQIDGKWYTLNKWSLELSLPSAPYAFDGWMRYDKRIEREWTFSGSTFDVFQNRFDSSPVPVLFHVDTKAFAGQAVITEVSSTVSMYDAISTDFYLRGIGSIVII